MTKALRSEPLNSSSGPLGVSNSDAFTEKQKEIDALVRDFQAAISLRRMFYQRDLDQRFIDGGGRIIFAIDSNLLSLHFSIFDEAAPAAHRKACQALGGPAQPEGSLEAQEFRHSLANAEHRLAQVVANYIINHLAGYKAEPSTPLLLLPGHNIEANRRYDELVDAMRDTGAKGKTLKARLSEFLRILSDQKTKEDRASVIEEQKDEIFALLYSLQEPHDKFREFAHLFAEKRLISMETAASDKRLSHLTFSDSDEQLFLHQAQRFSRSSDRPRGDWWETVDLPEEDNAGTEEWWSERLNKDMAISYVELDKLALATLDHLNRSIEKQKYRVVLLSLTSSIVEIGRLYKPYKYSKDLSRYRFSDLYIRSPRAFLSERQIMQPAIENDLTVWLDAFLARVTEQPHANLLEFEDAVENIETDTQALAQIAASALERDSNFHHELHQRWSEYAEQVTSDHSATSSEARALFERHIGTEFAAHEEMLSEFEGYMRKLTEDSWNTFFFTAVRSGRDLFHFDETRQTFELPLLYLRGMGAEAQRLTELTRNQGILDSWEEVELLLKRLNRREDDAAGYLTSLCYALLFARAGRWRLTQLIASRALAIARRSSESDPVTALGEITGREASYLAALSSRMVAKNRRDLDLSRDYIEGAFEAIDEVSDSSRLEGPEVTGIRFATEALSIDLATLYFDLHQNSWLSTALPYAANRARSLSARAEAQLNTLKCADGTIRVWTQISLRSIILSCVSVIDAMGELSAPDEAILKRNFAKQIVDLESLFGSAENRSMSVFEIYITRYGLTFFEERNDFLSGIEAEFEMLEKSQNKDQINYLLPYDRQRLKKLSQLIHRD